MQEVGILGHMFLTCHTAWTTAVVSNWSVTSLRYLMTDCEDDLHRSSEVTLASRAETLSKVLTSLSFVSSSIIVTSHGIL